MSIVCGTDFSTASWAAVEAAACIASLAHEPLHLVHSVQAAGDPEEGRQNLRMQRHAERLRRLTRDIHFHVCAGSPEKALTQLAARVAARLIVVGALGEPQRSCVALGGQADRLAERSLVPTLVVRDPTPFVSWACWGGRSASSLEPT